MEAMEAARRQVGGKTSCDCKGSEAMEANIPPLRNVERGVEAISQQSGGKSEASRSQTSLALQPFGGNGATLPLYL
jgi:hypothetical protein